MAVYDSPQAVHMQKAISGGKETKAKQSKKKSKDSKTTASKSAAKGTKRGR